MIDKTPFRLGVLLLLPGAGSSCANASTSAASDADLDALSAKVEALAEENAQLRDRVEALEGASFVTSADLDGLMAAEDIETWSGVWDARSEESDQTRLRLESASSDHWFEIPLVDDTCRFVYLAFTGWNPGASGGAASVVSSAGEPTGAYVDAVFNVVPGATVTHSTWVALPEGTRLWASVYSPPTSGDYYFQWHQMGCIR